jgi:hypothetical protein
MANFSDLTKLPATPGAPALDAKTVRLYRDAAWNSESWTISLDNWLPVQRHNVDNSIWDQATYVAFNLPVGIVVTLIDNIAPLAAGQNSADLKGCGVCVELVGTGQTEGLDLRNVSMNDCVSSFSWRPVDLDLGAIELFEHPGFTGNRAILFLAEWEPGKTHSIVPWWMNDKVSSVRWKTLDDRATAELFEHPDGGGSSFNNIMGFGSMKECGDLRNYRFDDTMSSFRWVGIAPKREIIKPFELTIPAGRVQTGFVVSQSVRNNGDENLKVPVTFSKKFGKTLTVSTTNTYVTGTKFTYSQKSTVEVSVPGIGTASEEITWGFEVSFSYTRSDTTTRTDTEETLIQQTAEIIIPPRKRGEARLFYAVGELPPTECQTTAERWYDRPLPRTVQDGAYYKREEPVRVAIQGGLVATGTVDLQQYNL